jgi:hypothetical protein
MSTPELELLREVVEKNGPIEILVYRSVSTGLDGQPRFIAHSLRYGELAGGSDAKEALRRTIVQVVGHLSHNRERGYELETWNNWAPSAVRQAWHLARPFPLNNGTLARFFSTKLALKFALQVRNLSEMQEEGVGLEEVVDAAFGVA